MAAQIILLEMNGDRISKNLSYLPSNRGFYNIVCKGEKQIRLNTAEECLKWLQEHRDEEKTYYVKVPQGMHTVALDSLRIA